MIKKIFKCILVCITVIICTFFTMSNTMSLELFRDGKGELNISINQDRLPESLETIDDFTAWIDAYIYKLNIESGDIDFIERKKVEQTDKGYSLTLRLRRIDKIKGLGEITYGTASSILSYEENLTTIKNFSNGVIREKIKRVYADLPNGDLVDPKNFQFKKGDNDIYIQPFQQKGEKILSYEDFCNTYAQSERKIVMFKLPDLRFAESIVINFAGNVECVSSQGMEIIGRDTVEMIPFAMEDASGETTSCVFGYVVYKQNMSPIAIGAIVIACIALGTFIVLGFCKGWFKRFFKSQLFTRLVKHKSFYLMLIPGFVILIVFHYAPMFGLTTAFQDYTITDGIHSEWVGLKYFQSILFAGTEHVYRIFRNTIYISLIRILSNFPIILAYTLLIHSIKNRILKQTFQIISYLPYFLSWVAVGGMMYSVLSEGGILNQALALFGIEAIPWYTEAEHWWGILAVSSLWKGMGWSTLIYLSALGNIDGELYEACALDGGGYLRQVFVVTLPGIMNVIMLQLILDTGSIMKDNYEQVLAMINGSEALDERVEVIGKFTFQAISRGSGYASATALGMIQGVIGLVLVSITNSIARKSGNEGVF